MVPDDAIFTFDQIAALLHVKPGTVRRWANLPETDPRHLSAFGPSQKVQHVIGRALNQWQARTTDLRQQRRAGPIGYVNGSQTPHGKRRGRPVR
jgi:hypothetical protein